MTDASGYRIQALDALSPANSSLGGRHSIVGRPTAIIAAALWLSSTSRFTAYKSGAVVAVLPIVWRMVIPVVLGGIVTTIVGVDVRITERALRPPKI